MWLNPQFPREILNGKLRFFCSVTSIKNCGKIILKPLVTSIFSMVLGKGPPGKKILET